MSGNKNTKVKRKKPDKRKLMVRVFCLVLAGLMVGSGAVALILELTSRSYAKDYGFDESLNVFVGIFYGDTSLSSATFQSSDGFSVGTVDSAGNFTPSTSTSASKITVRISSSVVTVTDTDGNQIAGIAGAAAIKPTNGYIDLSSTKFTYQGIMKCCDRNGMVEVINVLPVETYITGVIPNEINANWNIRTVCAFAVTVRSYTLSMLSRHSSDGFNLCAYSDHCQKYCGTKDVNNNVINAVNLTKGTVMTYKGNIVRAFYSDCGGGCSVDASDVWGGSYGYLKARATPWENYRDYKYGTWDVEYSGEQLLKRLQQNGYNGLDSPVVSVTIDSTGAGSTYVTGLTFTDQNGNTQKVTRCDKIRKVLGTRSANFVVGRAGETVTEIEFVPVKKESTVYVMTADGLETLDPSKDIKVAAAGGNATVTQKNVRVQTGYGAYDIDISKAYGTDWETLVYSDTKAEKRTVTLGGESGNFVFHGRGYGHGVGMSQLGAKHLGDMGADYQTILKAYFTDIAVEVIY